LLIVFFFEGIVHSEFVTNGQTANQTFYKEVLIRLRKKVGRKRNEKWLFTSGHYNNTPMQSALLNR